MKDLKLGGKIRFVNGCGWKGDSSPFPHSILPCVVAHGVFFYLGRANEQFCVPTCIWQPSKTARGLQSVCFSTPIGYSEDA